MAVNKISRETLAEAPELKIVWKRFVDYVGKYNPKQTKWDAPLAAGFNIENFDEEIIRRLCESYGPYDKEWNAQALFHPIHKADLIRTVWNWTENNPNIRSISMDAIREWLGLSKDGAHDAKVDVKQGAKILIRFMKLHRHFAEKVKFKGAMSNG